MTEERQSTIECLQINLQKSKSSTPALIKYIEDNSIDIVLFQEPYHQKEKIIGFSLKYNILYKITRQHPKTGIAITNKDINTINMTSMATNDLSIAVINAQNRQILLMSSYCSPNESLDSKLNNIQKVLNESEIKNIVICMDSNSHSKVWYDRHDDNRGDQINEFLAQNNLILLNNNENKPTFESNVGQSSIDLTIISPEMIGLITDWDVLDEETTSDHKYISFKLNEKFEKTKYKSTLKYITKDADWERLTIDFSPKIPYLLNAINNASTCDDINTVCLKITSEIIKSCDKCFRKINLNLKPKKSNKWWTEGLTSMRTTANRLRRRYQRCRSDQRQALKDNYYSYLILYKKAIFEAKIKSWNDFVAENSRENPWGLIYKIVRNKLKSEGVTELKTDDGRLLTIPQEIANYLMTTLFPTNESIPDLPVHQSLQNQLNEMNSDINFRQPNDKDFTEEEVTKVIYEQNHKKAPGMDGLTSDIIKTVHNINKTLFTCLYNRCLNINYFPNVCKQSVVKVIPKAGKPDYTDPNAHRPISLLPVLAKVLERLTIDRIVHFLRQNNSLNESQFGFTPQKSCEMALHVLKDFITDSYNKKGFALVLSLDISGAFNTCY
jgi:exonuclease III